MFIVHTLVSLTAECTAERFNHSFTDIFACRDGTKVLDVALTADSEAYMAAGEPATGEPALSAGVLQKRVTRI